jgi:hypothetical protein
MAVMVCLSAFAVWQGTRASDAADDVAAQIRVVEAQRQVWEGTLRTYIDHDAQVLAQYCDELAARDAALYQLMGDEPNAADVVPGQLAVASLSSLSLGGIPPGACSPAGPASSTSAEHFTISRAEAAMPPYPGDAAELESVDKQVHGAELWLMGAGLLFAVSLSGLIGVDVMGDRGHRPHRLAGAAVRRWRIVALLVALVSFAGGLCLLVGYGQTSHVAVVLLAIATLVLLRWRSSHRGGASRLDLRHPQWWAEVIGALTLVAFSAAALGLSSVSGEARSSRTVADGRREVSATLAQEGHLAALRDLNAAVQSALLDGQVAAANLRDDSPAAVAADAKRTQRESFLRDLERSIRSQLPGREADPNTLGCPKRIRGPDTDTRTLLDQIQHEPTTAARHIYAMQEATLECNVLADEAGATADQWSSRASLLTVSLVLLGLSGFLLALAADLGRTARSANWLLRTGVLGALAGVAVGLVVPIQARATRGPPTGPDLAAMARDFAVGTVNGCDVSPFDRAIKRAKTYGPAYAARAVALSCQMGAIPVAGVLTSDLQVDAVPALLADFAKAVELGPATPSAVANLGWASILSGIHAHSHAQLQKGLDLTDRAIKGLKPRTGPSGDMIHALRFNAALASAALGRQREAELGYRHAVGCLSPSAQCPGGGFEDPARRHENVLWALSDLELLPESSDVERLREIVVAAATGRHEGGQAWENAELDVFPQEFQVRGKGPAPDEASVVWYFRPSQRVAWGVLEAASTKTLQPGDNLDHPVAAGMVLPEGFYRADLYIGGRRVDSLDGERQDPKTSVRLTVPDLAVSVVVPDDWAYRKAYAGTDWESGPKEPADAGVWMHRVEGVMPDEDIDAYLDKTLANWLKATFGADVERAASSTDEEYFASLDYAHVRRYADIPLTAAIGFNNYTTNAWCGGAMLMTAVRGQSEDPEVMREVFISVALDGELPKLPEAGDTITLNSFTLTIPDGWDAARRPVGAVGDAFQARDCTTGSNVLVDDEDIGQESLTSYVDRSVKDLRSDPDFAQFKLIGRRTIHVKGSNEAAEIEYTFRSADSGPIRQRQIYATNGRRVVLMTFTAHDDGDPATKAASDTFTSSFAMRGG